MIRLLLCVCFIGAVTWTFDDDVAAVGAVRPVITCVSLCECVLTAAD